MSQNPAAPRYPYLRIRAHSRERERLSEALFSAGATGIEEQDERSLGSTAAKGQVVFIAHFADDAAALSAKDQLGADVKSELDHVVGDAWRDAWKKFFKPTRIGKRIVIRPSWEDFAAKPTDLVVTLDPGRAFGTGTHETTRLVLGLLEEHVKPGARVLDIGTGSGVLAIAAAKLGAKSVYGTDNDATAIAAAGENVEINDAADTIELHKVDLDGVKGPFDLVIANIEARVLLPMARRIRELVAKNGTVILSGLLRNQRGSIEAAYQGLTDSGEAPLGTVSVREEGDWIALVLSPKLRKLEIEHGPSVSGVWDRGQEDWIAKIASRALSPRADGRAVRELVRIDHPLARALSLEWYARARDGGPDALSLAGGRLVLDAPELRKVARQTLRDGLISTTNQPRWSHDNALGALGDAGTAADIPALAALLSEMRPALQSIAGDALLNVERRSPGSVRRAGLAPQIRIAVQNAPRGRPSVALVRLLGEIAAPAEVEMLERIAESGKGDAAFEAAAILVAKSPGRFLSLAEKVLDKVTRNTDESIVIGLKRAVSSARGRAKKTHPQKSGKKSAAKSKQRKENARRGPVTRGSRVGR